MLAPRLWQVSPCMVDLKSTALECSQCEHPGHLSISMVMDFVFDLLISNAILYNEIGCFLFLFLFCHTGFKLRAYDYFQSQTVF